jgi:hypothetical protein
MASEIQLSAEQKKTIQTYSISTGQPYTIEQQGNDLVLRSADNISNQTNINSINTAINTATNNILVSPKADTGTSKKPETASAVASKKDNLPKVDPKRVEPPTSTLATTIEEQKEIDRQIRSLELKTNLNLLPYILGGELARIKHQFTDLNKCKYFLLLNFLVNGFDNSIMTVEIKTDDTKCKCVADDIFIKDFQRMLQIPQLTNILKKTPAYFKGSFDGIGQFGNIEANGDRRDNNAMTGPNRYTPSLVTNAMEKMWPGSVNNLEKFCNTIRTRSYLSMPSGSFGSIKRIINIINGVTKLLNTLVNDFYKQLTKFIREVYATINGIINEIKTYLLNLINEIIPLDLLCLILDTVQVVLDDINFFTSLFNARGPWLNYLNTIQTYVNTSSNFIQNPFTTLAGFLPPEVSNYIDKFEELGDDPEGFISDQLSNYGLSYINTALQGDVVGALVEKFGSKYASGVTPLSEVMSKAKAIWERYNSDGSELPTSVQDLMDSNYFNGGTEDALGNPKDPYDVVANLKANFKVINKELEGLKSDVPNDLAGVGDFFNSLNPFSSKGANLDIPEDEESLTDTPNPNQQRLPAT